jgi:hypothetical protein
VIFLSTKRRQHFCHCSVLWARKNSYMAKFSYLWQFCLNVFIIKDKILGKEYLFVYGKAPCVLASSVTVYNCIFNLLLKKGLTCYIYSITMLSFDLISYVL